MRTISPGMCLQEQEWNCWLPLTEASFPGDRVVSLKSTCSTPTPPLDNCLFFIVWKKGNIQETFESYISCLCMFFSFRHLFLNLFNISHLNTSGRRRYLERIMQSVVVHGAIRLEYLDPFVVCSRIKDWLETNPKTHLHESTGTAH